MDDIRLNHAVDLHNLRLDAAAVAEQQRKAMAALLTNHAIDLHSSRLDAVAESTMRRAIGLDRNHFTLTQLAAFLTLAGRLDEASRILDEVLAINSDYAPAWDIMGYMYFGQGNIDLAIEAHRRAVALDPHNRPYRFDLACTQLAAGDYLNGFAGYECRSRDAPWHAPWRTNLAPPEWKGEPGLHVCVWWDQGAGDMFLMLRVLPWVAQHAARVTLAVPAHAVALFGGLAGICEVVPNHAAADYDVQIPLMSVPRVMGLTIDRIPPPAGPFLTAAGIFGEFWPGPEKKIGVCWAGTRGQGSDRRRSMPFTTMARLAENPDLRLFSFQVGERCADISANRAERLVENQAARIDGNWSATAGLLQHMDAVVTVCTGVAHLAASLGVPTYVCLHETPYWIWGRHGDTTPWYPSAKLFRQHTPGDWDGVIDRVAAAVAV